MGTTFYGSGFIHNGLFVLDICYSNNDSNSFFTTADNFIDMLDLAILVKIE